MIWGIIGAMPSEIALLKAQMVDAKEEIVSGLTYQSGKSAEKMLFCAAAKSAKSTPLCARKRWRCDIMWII